MSGLGALVLATGLDRDPARAQLVDDHLASLVDVLVLLGAEPVIVVHDGTPRIPPAARELRMPRPARDDHSALRLGLLQFANAPVGAALVLPVEAHDTDPLLLRRLVEETTRRGLPLAATAANGVLGYPLFATRDTWRDLLTVEGGVEAVLRQRRPHVLALEPE
jgi:hypothetical protein